jgi:hypothetical protein
MWNSTCFSFSMSIIDLCYSSLFVIIFIVSLLIIFKAQFELLTACLLVAVSRCRFVIPATNIGGGAGSCPSCLALLSVSACRRASNY